MGLLDALFPSGGGGLLDLLRNNAQNQDMAPGLLTSQGYGQQGQNSLPIFPQPQMTAPSQQPIPQQPPQVMQAQPAPQPAPQPSGPGIGDRLMAGFQSFAHGGGLLPAIANGISGLATGQRADNEGIAQQQQFVAQNQTLQALIQKGVDPVTAHAAIGNPEMLKALIAQNFGPDKFQHVTQTDAFGNQTIGAFDPTTGKTKFENSDGAASGSSMLAPGVTAIDSTLTGEPYLKQFSPEVQAAVHNYAEGKSTPTGNPRKGFTQIVKMVSQKYGEDTGQSIDDTTYSARRTMRNQLSSSAPSSLGGQINIGNTAAGHLADLTEKALDLNNKDIGWTWGSHMINEARGLNTAQSAKMEALKGAAQHYGQEITKFYAGSPGGVAERDRFIESVGGAKTPQELAAILTTEGELMRSRLDALGGQIKGVLGDEGLQQYPVLRPDGEAALAKVEQNVSKLKGGASNSSPAKPASVIQNGHTYTLQPDGSYK